MGKECALVYCSTICYAGKNRYNWIRGTAPHFSCKYGHWSIKRNFICSRHRVCNDEKEIISWRGHGRNFTRSYFYSPRLLNSTCWQKHATREAFRVRGKDVVFLAGFEPWTQNHCIRRGRYIHSANSTWTARYWYCYHFSIYLFEGFFANTENIREQVPGSSNSFALAITCLEASHINIIIAYTTHRGHLFDNQSRCC